jgi:hypothetical protein
MDTDALNPRRNFTLTTFHDRAQIDDPYDRISKKKSPRLAHQNQITDGQSTCWDLNDDI